MVKINDALEAYQRIEAKLLSGSCTGEDICRDLSILKCACMASEILRIIWNSPFILQVLYEKNELGKDVSQRYAFGTITEADRKEVKEFFQDVKMRN